MTFSNIVKEIHASHCEYDVLAYLAKWANQENDRVLMENCELRSSLNLLKKFNDVKWHNELIGNLTDRSGCKYNDRSSC